MFSTDVITQRCQLSSRAWEYARWIDGRRVVLGGVNEDLAWAQPAVSTHLEDHRHMDSLREYMTWEEAATRLLAPLPIFGPPNRQPPTGFVEEPCDHEME